MQLTPTASPVSAPKTTQVPNPTPVDPNTPPPIGVTTFGELRIGHSLNGVSYTDHQLTGPLSGSFAEFSGSLQDAIVSATAYIRDLEMRMGVDGRVAVALLGLPGHWIARPLNADETVLRAIDNGVGSGGIASIDFTSRSRSLGALVTSEGSLVPGQR